MLLKLKSSSISKMKFSVKENWWFKISGHRESSQGYQCNFMFVFSLVNYIFQLFPAYTSSLSTCIGDHCWERWAAPSPGRRQLTLKMIKSLMGLQRYYPLWATVKQHYPRGRPVRPAAVQSRPNLISAWQYSAIVWLVRRCLIWER